jgi:predicted nucleic acid-binding protein
VVKISSACWPVGDSFVTRRSHRQACREYAELPLGFADAAVVACAERSRGRVLTLDLHDFVVVARAGSITILPD